MLVSESTVSRGTHTFQIDGCGFRVGSSDIDTLWSGGLASGLDRHDDERSRSNRKWLVCMFEVESTFEGRIEGFGMKSSSVLELLCFWRKRVLWNLGKLGRRAYRAHDILVPHGCDGCSQ